MREVKSSDVLRQARRFLWKGETPIPSTEHEYICWAVEDAGNYLLASRTNPIVVNIKDRIMRRINCCTVNEWLAKNVPGYCQWRDSSTAQHYRYQLQQYRHRWLDSLIAEYEAEGD